MAKIKQSEILTISELETTVKPHFEELHNKMVEYEASKKDTSEDLG